MEKLHIRGGVPLHGSVCVSGSKNAVLPMLLASLLSDGALKIRNVPHLHDVTTTIDMLGQMGVTVVVDESTSVEVDSSTLRSFFTPNDIVKTMRASVLVLGPLLARHGVAKVAFPGGCAIGSRPIDIHLNGLKAMGATIKISDDGYIEASCQSRLKGTRLVFDCITVTGTENLMMAATLATGTTSLENAAREPEVVDLANCLNRMGANIEGAGTSTVRIHGVNTLSGCTIDVLPDRIEASTYLVAAAITRGKVTVENARAELMDAVLCKLYEAGAEIQVSENSITLDMSTRRPRGTDITTAPFPAFPTDMQAQFTSLNAISTGKSVVTETVFENRFMHVDEICRMGASITVRGNCAHIEGTEKLHGAKVAATDLRASASLILAGLVADGETVVDNIYHIDRGYECIEEKLAHLGANIRRVPTRVPGG